MDQKVSPAESFMKDVFKFVSGVLLIIAAAWSLTCPLQHDYSLSNHNITAILGFLIGSLLAKQAAGVMRYKDKEEVSVRAENTQNAAGDIGIGVSPSLNGNHRS